MRSDGFAVSAQKSSQKSTRPRGAKDVATFPGAIGRNNACVRADAQRVARGEERLPRVGEGIVAEGWDPCQCQPLRGSFLPSTGASRVQTLPTWFVGLRAATISKPRPFCRRPRFCFVRNGVRRGRGQYGRKKSGSRAIYAIYDFM